MNLSPRLKLAVDALVAEIERRRLGALRPLAVAIDGRSGSGKSTVASLVAAAVGGALVPCDDFFAADIPAAGWAVSLVAGALVGHEAVRPQPGSRPGAG
jgi:hypothetical protein